MNGLPLRDSSCKDSTWSRRIRMVARVKRIQIDANGGMMDNLTDSNREAWCVLKKGAPSGHVRKKSSDLSRSRPLKGTPDETFRSHQRAARDPAACFSCRPPREARVFLTLHGHPDYHRLLPNPMNGMAATGEQRST